MKLLFVAADSMEYSGILEHTTQSVAARFAVRWARAGTLAGHAVLLVANGAGRRQAAAGMEACAAEFQPDAVVSTGFCGALEDRMQIADIVVATQVASDDQTYQAGFCDKGPHRNRRGPGRAPSECHTGLIRTIDHVAQTAAEKRQLRAGGACAVEMEASAVAQRAAQLGLPFYCVRSITDLAGEDMANDFNASLRPDGHFDTMFILRRMLGDPAARLPELLRLRKRCARAARSLGEFFADCRF